jgi:hypothetical protein
MEMHGKTPLSYILTALVLLAFAVHVGSAETNWGSVQITSIYAPPSVAVSQPITVSIAVSYDLTQPLIKEGLLIELVEPTQPGTPYAVTDVSNNCQPPLTVSLCFANVPQQQPPNVRDITVYFTLIAPSTSETWRPSALALIISWNQNGSYTTQQTASKVVTITVT